MNYKTITISLTGTLILSYAALVFSYGAAVAEDFSNEKVRYGRNIAVEILLQNTKSDQAYHHYSEAS